MISIDTMTDEDFSEMMQKKHMALKNLLKELTKELTQEDKVFVMIYLINATLSSIMKAAKDKQGAYRIIIKNLHDCIQSNVIMEKKK